MKSSITYPFKAAGMYLALHFNQVLFQFYLRVRNPFPRVAPCEVINPQVRAKASIAQSLVRHAQI
jgi:hypothetical protein